MSLLVLAIILLLVPIAVPGPTCTGPSPSFLEGSFGGCTGENGTALVLGHSYQCHHCSNAGLAYLLLFALLGIVGVAVLALLGLTVATGMINTVILYANIVQANYHIFFNFMLTPQGNSDCSRGLRTFLTMFLSWLNLEWGFETCFYKKMNAIAKTSLCYVFPIYVCILATIFVKVVERMDRTRQYCRKLAYSVLATTILMAFSPIMRAFIDSSLRTCTCTRGRCCWLFKLDQKFFKNEHSTIFAVGFLILLFFLLPFTLILTFTPLLKPLAHFRPLSWIKKPYISSITGKFYSPLRTNSLWPGIGLFVRVLLFSTAAAVKNCSISPDTNLRVLTITLLCLLFLTWPLGAPYKNVLPNVTAMALLTNLGVLTVWSGGDHQCILTYSMVGVAALTFVATICLQAVQRVRQLLSCVRDCRQRQNYTVDLDRILSLVSVEGIDSIHNSLEAEYYEVDSDMVGCEVENRGYDAGPGTGDIHVRPGTSDSQVGPDTGDRVGPHIGDRVGPHTDENQAGPGN